MVPAKVYVGDKARLILPLPNNFVSSSFLIPNSSFLIFPDITIHQVTLERRPGGNSLVIEFSAYRPGMVELPPLEIGGEILSGLSVEISSILGSGESAMVLSDPALPLAIPGTSLLVYGTISVIALSLLLGSWVLFWGRKRMQAWLAKWKRKRMFAAMWGTEKRLRKALMRGMVPDLVRREILDTLSTEFRSFLAWFTGENCRAMTAAEIGCIEGGGVLDSKSLEIFFSRCDTARFSGCAIGTDEALVLLDEFKQFLAATAQDSVR